jgi:hypothetical protein
MEKILAEFLERNFSILIEIELRRLHRRFDHFSTPRVHRILERVDHDVESQTVKNLAKYFLMK